MVPARAHGHVSAGMSGPAVLLLLLLGGTAARAGGNELTAEVGLGYDSNPYLTPDEAYFDQNALVTIDPNPEGGLFVPVTIRGSYQAGAGASRFVTGYRLSGDFYPESGTSNADESYLRLAPAWEWAFGAKGSRENLLSVGPFAAYNEEIFFDRDTGLDTEVGGASAADRFTYTSLGAEARAEWRTHRTVETSLGVRLESRDYDEVEGVFSLDHDRYQLDAGLEIAAGESTTLYLDYRYKVRDYDDRPSRTLEGQALASNPRLKYTHHGLGATARFRVLQPWTLYVDADYRTRQDGFAGYSDYQQNGLQLRSILKSDRRRLRLAVEYWERDYDSAFIFDSEVNPADGRPNPHKSYETLELSLRGEQRLGDHWTAFVEIDYRDQDTADPRFTYDRSQVVAGIRWEL